uniref:Uncharacterized protein n=1 Tax=Arundo donax TaxID=35708 RepID=A0A0A9F1Q7_ARUDO
MRYYRRKTSNDLQIYLLSQELQTRKLLQHKQIQHRYYWSIAT